MGYRARLGRVEKTEKARFAGKTCEEAEEMMEESYSCYRPGFHFELYELGKYCEFDIKPESFYDFDVEKECECEFHILSKDGLKQIIAEYHEKVASNYREISEKGEWRQFIESRNREWNKKSSYGMLPYKLDEDPQRGDGNLINSWQYEYGIFELVSIYRTFDWEKNYLIYSAW